LIDTGLALYNQGKYEEAVECYDKVLKVEPNNVYFLTNKGNALKNQGKYQEAINCYDQVLAIDPNIVDAMNGKCDILYNIGKYKKAIECYDKALRVEPNNIYALCSKGDVLYMQDKIQKAIEYYDKALRVDPNNTLAHKKIILAIARLSSHEAIEYYDKALRIEPNNVYFLNNKGDVLYTQGKIQEAIDCYDQVLAIYPNNTLAQNNKKEALSRLSNYKAIEYYDKALRVDPNNIDALNGKGNALKNQGKAQEAIACYDMTLKIDPNNTLAQNNKKGALELLSYQKERLSYQKAIEYYDKALEIAPNDVTILNSKGLVLYNLGKAQEAIECYDKALRVEPNNTLAQNNKKEALELLSYQKERLSSYRKSLYVKENFSKKISDYVLSPVGVGTMDIIGWNSSSSSSSYSNTISEGTIPKYTIITKKPLESKTETTVERYPYATFPEKVVIGETAPLKILIKAIRPILDKDKPVSQGIGTIKIISTNDEKKQVPIRIFVEQDNFEVVGGIYDKTIFVPISNDDSKPVLFDLKAKKEGKQDIIIQFFQQGNYVGEVQLNTIVLPKVPVYSSTLLEQQPSSSSQSKQLLWDPSKVPTRPDVALYIYEKKRYPEYEYEIWLTSADFDNYPIGSKTLTHEAESRIRALFYDIENTNLPADIFDSRMKAKGRLLYKELFSEELKKFYWQNKSRIKSFQVITKDPWIPWEIIRPYDVDTGQEDAFLCECCAFSRWILGKKIVIPNEQLNKVLVVVPSTTDLANSIEERNWIQQFGTSIGAEVNTDSKYRHIISALWKGEFHILHFSTHGKYNKDHPLFSHIELENGLFLRPEDIEEISVNFRQAKPIVIFNTCQSGVQGFSLTEIKSWATQFLDAGASVFVGTLWRVSDKAAFKFTQELYKQLSSGIALGEAVKKARNNCKERGDSSWLAYEVYGQPNSFIKLGS
jgi:tetratricopeptide (TPR) repeat protein